MSFTQRTPLGRKVKLDDWLGLARDRLLAALYTLRDAGIEGVTVEQVTEIVHLSGNDRATMLYQMHERGFLQGHDGKHFIAERGIRWVEESPQQP